MICPNLADDGFGLASDQVLRDCAADRAGNRGIPACAKREGDRDGFRIDLPSRMSDPF